MGLHRLDDPNAEFEMMPTLLPPKDWIELEGMNFSPSLDILSTEDDDNRETKGVLGRVCYRLTRIDQHRMADIDRCRRGQLAILLAWRWKAV